MPKGHEKDSSKTQNTFSSDNIRDSRDVTNILSILDNPIVRTNPFGANVTGDTSYRRAERISAALHLITNHVPDNEPLRTAVRTGGIELLGLLLGLRSGFRSLASEKGQASLASIRELISLVRLLAVAGYVSSQNVNAIAEALDELGSLIVVSQRSVLAEQVSISRDDLMPAQKTPFRTESPIKNISRTVGPVQRVNVQKDTQKDVSDTNSARSGQIMDILKLGGMLGIKDISANLPQYSEKMIQRELAYLVESNKVKKIGAKRWSRYQIVS
jgi:hypothetical protein